MSINEDIGVIFSEKNYLPKDISEKQKYKAWIIKNNISYTIYHFFNRISLLLFFLLKPKY